MKIYRVKSLENKNKDRFFYIQKLKIYNNECNKFIKKKY